MRAQLSDSLSLEKVMAFQCMNCDGVVVRKGEESLTERVKPGIIFLDVCSSGKSLCNPSVIVRLPVLQSYNNRLLHGQLSECNVYQNILCKGWSIIQSQLISAVSFSALTVFALTGS